MLDVELEVYDMSDGGSMEGVDGGNKVPSGV
jgi:hypothetical protein